MQAPGLSDSFFDAGDVPSGSIKEKDAIKNVLGSFFPRADWNTLRTNYLELYLGSHVITVKQETPKICKEWAATWSMTLGNNPIVARNGIRLPLLHMGDKAFTDPKQLRLWLHKVASGIMAASTDILIDALHPDNFMKDARNAFQAAHNLRALNLTYPLYEDTIVQSVPWRHQQADPNKPDQQYKSTIFRGGKPIGAIGCTCRPSGWVYGIYLERHSLVAGEKPLQLKQDAPPAIATDAAALLGAEKFYAQSVMGWISDVCEQENLRIF